MALGFSSPEILLSSIEIVGNSFYAGYLGPGSIVGGAAFNMCCITAVCVIAAPKTIRIKSINVCLHYNHPRFTVIIIIITIIVIYYYYYYYFTKILE